MTHHVEAMLAWEQTHAPGWQQRSVSRCMTCCGAHGWMRGNAQSMQQRMQWSHAPLPPNWVKGVQGGG